MGWLLRGHTGIGERLSASEDVERFAGRLRGLKERTGRSYEALANRIGVSDSALHRYCSGAGVPPDYAPIELFARACGARPDELVELHRLWILADGSRLRARGRRVIAGNAPARHVAEEAPSWTAADAVAPAPESRQDLASDPGDWVPARGSRRHSRSRLLTAAVALCAVLGLVLTVGLWRWPHSQPSAAAPRAAKHAGPAAWWKLDERDGLVAKDSSGNGMDGGFTAVTWLPGHAGNAASLDGGSFLTVNQAVLDTSHSFSVSAWVRLSNTMDWATAVSQDGARNSGFFLQYAKVGDRWAFGKPTADVDNALVDYALSAKPPVLGRWTHLVGVYDERRRRNLLYVDGVLQSQQESTRPWRARGRVLIGAAEWSGSSGVNLWPGQIDDVRLFQAALTDREVRQLP